MKWWEYRTTFEGVNIRIYGVREGPPTCTAIFETRVAEKQVPVLFETQSIEEQVLVGWDCGEAEERGSAEGFRTEPADLGLVAVPTPTPVVESGGSPMELDR